MSGDSQRGPGSGGKADRGRPGAGQARQDAGGQSPPGDGQDHVGTPRPDALIPELDEGQLAALREVGREWDRVSADPQVWRQALPVDPSLGEYPEASEIRPGLFTRVVPVAGPDGQLPPIQTTSASETPFREKLKSRGIETLPEPEILWNFEKFLVSRQGEVVRRFSPDTQPDAPELIAAIEAELAKS